MRRHLITAATLVGLSVLMGCGGDDGEATAQDSASRIISASPSSGPSDSPTVGTYPQLDAQDYTYVLEQVCFCPITGPVEVVVEDGEVVSAQILKGAPGIEKGSAAPEYLRITINDIIARANDTDAAKVEVVWPDDQDWPSRVAVDKVKLTTDDEVTYLIRRVRLSA